MAGHQSSTLLLTLAGAFPGDRVALPGLILVGGLDLFCHMAFRAGYCWRQILPVPGLGGDRLAVRRILNTSGSTGSDIMRDSHGITVPTLESGVFFAV